VLNITERQADYATQVTESLKKQGVRAITDLRNEKIGLKIREHTLQRVPYLLVVGDKEVAANQLAVRTRAARIWVRCLWRRSLNACRSNSAATVAELWRIDASLLHPSASGATTRSLRPVCG